MLRAREIQHGDEGGKDILFATLFSVLVLPLEMQVVRNSYKISRGLSPPPLPT